MPDRKYLVVKREDFDELLRTTLKADDRVGHHRLTCVEDMALDDAVVIRTRDRFAAPALHAYTEAIRNTVDLLDIYGLPAPPGLRDVADYFHERAMEAMEHSEKQFPGVQLPPPGS